jgi:transketolase C-terminal domain/subunit
MEFKGSREAFVAARVELAEEDPRVVFVSAASMKAARAKAIVDRFPDRYIEAGLAEQNAVAIASGLSSCGLKPT